MKAIKNVEYCKRREILMKLVTWRKMSVLMEAPQLLKNCLSYCHSKERAVFNKHY